MASVNAAAARLDAHFLADQPRRAAVTMASRVRSVVRQLTSRIDITGAAIFPRWQHMVIEVKVMSTSTVPGRRPRPAASSSPRLPNWLSLNSAAFKWLEIGLLVST